MLNEKLVLQLKTSYEFFRNSSACLGEEDSGYAPRQGMFTAARQVAHAAHTVDWFVEGMFSPEGFDTDWEKLEAACLKVDSLEEARRWLKEAFDRAIEVIKSKTDEELLQPLPEGPVLGGVPRIAALDGLFDHTAHHRGALAVYSRLLGKVPAMPYGEG